jgi:hypothetical protein
VALFHHMNYAIELHDSACLAIECDSRGNGSVLLDAYVHRAQGEPGLSLGEGGEQKVRIRMASMCVTGELGVLPATIYEGSLTIGAAVLDNIVPFPRESRDKRNLWLMLGEGAREMSNSGTSLSILPESPFKFLERFDSSDR